MNKGVESNDKSAEISIGSELYRRAQFQIIELEVVEMKCLTV